MPTYQIVAAAGIILMLAGGIPGAIGTTSTGLFALYGAMFIGGALLLALSKKLKDQA